MESAFIKETLMGRVNRSAVAVALLAVAVISSLEAKNPPPPAAIPAGVEINVRVADKLSSAKTKAGDLFKGTLETPIVANNQVLAPKKAEVMGYVARAHASSGANDPGVLELDLISVKMGDNYVPVNATLVMKGESHTKHDAKAGTAKVVLVSAPAAGETVVESKAVLSWVSSPAGSAQDWTSNRPKDVHAGSGTPFRILGHDEDKQEEAQAEPAAAASYSFTATDRRLIRQCLSGGHAAPASGYQVTPAVMRQLQRKQPLPAALQKRAQPLPSTCAAKLRNLPGNWTVVAVAGRVVLLDQAAKVADLFVIALPTHTVQVRRVSSAR